MVVAVVLAAGAARASDLANFNGAVAAAYVHYRGAVSYLRTENTALAALELDDMAAKWGDVIARYGEAAPDAFKDDAAWAATLRGVGVRLDNALDAIDAGDAKGAIETLAPIRGELADLRRRNGVTVFSDRIDEVSAAMDALWTYRRGTPDLADADVAHDIAAKTAVLAYVLERCRAQAPAAVRESADFSRLVEGSDEGIRRMWRALAERDEELLVNTLGELRAFERILFLKFG
jgi:hypothetical protein